MNVQFTNYLINKETFAHSLNPSHNCSLIPTSKASEPVVVDWVDLGLPSGTKWAKCNIGANSPEEAGLYFAWGETVGYTADQIGTDKNFSWADYKWGTQNNLTKYNSIDGLVTLEDSDDAAYQATNGRFKMPTNEQQVELFNNTNNEWAQENGVYGYKFTNKSDSSKYIFVPAVGLGSDGSLYGGGGSGFFWSSSLGSVSVSYALYSGFSGDEAGVGYDNVRCFGQSVRGVLNE